MTSGPIINTDIDNKYFLGDIIEADGKKHVLNIDAYASGESDDKLSYVIVFRNGKIAKLWDLRKDNVRKFDGTFTLHEKDNAWYVVKVYGKDSWQTNQMLDVMRIAQKNATDSIEYREGENDVAITNPFYFRKKGQEELAVLQSQINLMLNEGASKINNASIEIMVAGTTIKKINIANGTAKFAMPVNGILKISAQGKNPVYRSLYLDYLPHQQILEEIASGRWRDKYEGKKKFNPGEIPWEEFHFEKAKAFLTNVNWTIDVTPNERDKEWPRFEALFRD